MEHQQRTLNCRGKLLDLSEPQIMGILNITPDSFFDGGKYNQKDSIIEQCARMIREGASILDIGGMSSRPGAKVISAEEEKTRVLPVIEMLRQEFPDVILSLDTIRGSVAKKGLEKGIHIINDISAGSIDPSILEITARYKAPYVLMHMQGRPENMQDNPVYANILEEVYDFFVAAIDRLRGMGIRDIIADPGFGFGKKVEDNYALLKHLRLFSNLEIPLLAGVSRKSMVCKVLNVNPDKALNGTTALHMVALQQGARILRVHDVREAAETIKLWQQLEKTE
ncbi:MAG: dihydropteroate synthase [Bacteroidetes bacterium]|nr:dihydropteroate synthase [Bacteroidota bacterium]